MKVPVEVFLADVVKELRKEPLKEEGADVRFELYEGPHGWPLDKQPHPIMVIRKAFAWMAEED